MKNHVFSIILLFFFLPLISFPQIKQANSPGMQIITGDIDNFWIAYDHLKVCKTADDSINCIKTLYFDNGTEGLKEFLKKYQYSPQDYLLKISQYPGFFRSIRQNTLLTKTIGNEADQFLEKVWKYYPDYKPKKICFLISPIECGGTTTENYLFAGAEILTSSKEADLSEFGNSVFGKVLAFDTNVRERLIFVIAHETVHDLQINAEFNNYNLLNKSLNEGSADFIAMLFTGVLANQYLMEYGNLHEKELWVRYKQDIENNENTDNWMYNYDRVENGVPADLGYYMGYKITESYYNQCTDKNSAIHAIIESKNPKGFLKNSGYDNKF
ncbi:MAG: hypothetical protein HXX13_02960 [Bacteroidetes bacterium]|nr:hypothetical protein [Bacteroidota bacterium]